MEKLYVISDLHLGPPGALNNFHAGPELVAFVRSLAAGSTLVIAGDFLDLLQVAGRPRVLDLEGAPGLIRELLASVEEAPWGRELFAALGELAGSGGRCVVLPGNHDPELFHPEVERVLRAKAGLEEGEPGLAVHRAVEPWAGQVGQWSVVIGHGHLRDPWNRISPQKVHRALARGQRSLPLPVGSLLVLETIQAFKRACDPISGEPRFPFVDLLKPEGPWVPLLLLALDPSLALAHLPGAAGHGLEALLRSFGHRLRQGSTLATGSPGEEPQDLDLTAALADALAQVLTPAEKASAAVTLQELENALRGGSVARPGSLAAGGTGTKLLLRAARSGWNDGGSFFDRQCLSHHDQRIVDEHLVGAPTPRVVVSGHTHAAREVEVAGDRIYLNTGTWADLMQVPEMGGDEAALTSWFADLKRGVAPRLRSLTFAEITPEAARLDVWRPPACRGSSETSG